MACAKMAAALCAICGLPASNGGHSGDARCRDCDETTGGRALVAAKPSMRDALACTLRDALVEASSKATIPRWLDADERPERSLQANLRALSAAMLQATAQCGDYSVDSEKPSRMELTARDVARVMCLGPALVTAAGVLGGPQLSAPLSRTVRLALLACESTGGSAEAFAAAIERLREAADADAPITLPLLRSAVCAPRALEVAEAALRGRREGTLATRGESLASCTVHGAATCDCGGVMGGGFL